MMQTKEIIDFYNQYTVKQKKTGINPRHKSILRKAVDMGLKPHHHVLEIGCGIGTFTRFLQKYLKKGTLYSCDISDESIKIAEKTLGNYKNLTLATQNAVTFCLDRRFDVIILPDVIEHIPLEYHAGMFQNLSKMLKENGFIYIHIPNPYYLAWDRLYHPEELQIVDQPVYLDEMMQNIADTDLYLYYEETYMIWIEGGDYTHRVLRKKPDLTSSIFRKHKPAFLRRIINKIKGMLRK